ncbi:MAG: SprT family zinc-dependent metalloprotease [Candidatus Cloacimonetes bacterium]|nr:SprT family zinc-dependent metalloprotease [Candidatus Cloacimonadota bacterium]
MPNKEYFIEFEKFKIKVTQKKVKNIYLRINRKAEITITAPVFHNEKTISHFIRTKQEWLISKVQQITEEISEKETLCNKKNEQFYYLGKKYDIVFCDSEKRMINTVDNTVYFSGVNNDDTITIDKLKNQWYYSQAETIFSDILSVEFKKFQKYNLANPVLKIRKMRRRWGTCYHGKGNIILNLNLIKVPLECIRYVITHELTHLIAPNHGKQFYLLLSENMSEWKPLRAQLKTYNFVLEDV